MEISNGKMIVGIIENVFKDAKEGPIYIIKSTVLPGTTEMLQRQYPNHFKYRVEDEETKLFNYLSVRYDLKNPYAVPSNNYNSRKTKIKEIDYSVVRPKYQKMINNYCREYGYKEVF